MHHVGDSFPVFKNPTDNQYLSLVARFRAEYPGAPAGEPKVRKTFDREGNVYYWMSGDSAHYFVESRLKKLGIETNQNKYFD